jgi:hypothetical protein
MGAALRLTELDSIMVGAALRRTELCLRGARSTDAASDSTSSASSMSADMEEDIRTTS